MADGIVKVLGVPLPGVLAVVGCGGKTSLIGRLAGGYPDRRVLISPTTRMYPMRAGNADCLGVPCDETGKLKALPPGELARLIPGYDLTLLEADGSRGLPCKGWREDEPVVPEYCSHTVGVVAMNGLGRAATEETVCNLPLFLALTGLREGVAITAQALRDMICAPGGMFKNSVGERILLVNQVEDERTADIAREFLRGVGCAHPGLFAKLLYGSVHHDSWREVNR